MPSNLHRIWDFLSVPASYNFSPQTRAQSRLLVILLLLAMLSCIGFAVLGNASTLLWLVLIALVGITALNKMGWVHVAAHLFLQILLIACIAASIIPEAMTIQPLYYLSIAIWAAWILLDLRQTLIYSALSIGAVLVLALLSDDAAFSDTVWQPLGLLWLTSCGIGVLHLQRGHATVADSSSNLTTDAFRLLPDSLFYCDAQEKVLAGKLAASLVGQGISGDVVGKNLAELLLPEITAQVQDQVRQTVKKQQLQVSEFTVSSGERQRHYEARTIPSQSDTVLCLIRDISSRVEAEAALQANQERLGQRMAELKVLQQLDQELGFTLDANHVLKLAMDFVMRRTHAASVVVGWIEPDSAVLRRVGQSGDSTLLAKPLMISDAGLASQSSELHQVLTTNEPHIVTATDGTQSIYLPLTVRRQASGVLCVEHIHPDTLQSGDVDFLKQVASRTAEALNNASDYAAIQKHVRQSALLYETSKDLAASTHHAEVMNIATQAFVDLLDVGGAHFATYDAYAKIAPIRASHFAPPYQQFAAATIDPTLCYPLAKRAADEGLFNVSVEEAEKVERKVLLGLRAHVLLVVPVRQDQRVLGIVILAEFHTARSFSSAEGALAQNLAAQTSIAFQRANLISNMQEIERVKSEMLRVASHDLRNPLAQMQGYFELLVDDLGTLSELQQEYVNSINRGSLKMERLLEDILNLERIESQDPDTWAALPIQALVGMVYQNLMDQASLKKQNFQLQANRQDRQTKVRGSEIQLEQALTNLIGNAIKYTPENGTVTVKGQIEGDEYVFAVEDSGYGIPVEKQEKIFTRFYRANAPGTEHIGGTGLGLSLVKAIVERHGGSVFFESEYKKGSTFGFRLPLIMINDG